VTKSSSGLKLYFFIGSSKRSMVTIYKPRK